MARRMYDLDNGTENIKVKDITCNKITAVTSAITTECDDLVVNGTLTVKGGGTSNNITIGSGSGGNPDYINSDGALDLRSQTVAVVSLFTNKISVNRVLTFANYTTVGRPSYMGEGNYAGSVIYDSDLAKLILWNGTAWVNLDGTALS
jgi:hypothetical protein